MEEEDDDFYGGGIPQNGHDGAVKNEHEDDIKPEQPDTDMEDGEEDDSDDDFQITLEKPEGAKAAAPSSSTNASAKNLARPQQLDRTASSGTPDQPNNRPGSARPNIKSEAGASRSSAAVSAPSAIKGVLTHQGREGRDFPEVRTSSVDVDANPAWPGGAPSGGGSKPLLEVDIDADLAEHSKPWRLPGTDQTDFFNYGFDEYTWTQYCVRQQTMSGTIAQQKEADAQMKAFFGGGGGAPGGGGAAPGGMPPQMGPGGGGMPPGMPDPQQMMEMMNAGMLPPEFAQMMQMGGGGGGPMGFGGGLQGNPFGGQGGGGGGGGNGGYGSSSPQPPGGPGGFAPPTGPGGQQQQQGGNLEGYSPQQLAMMQDQQQGGGGGGGGRGRGRRGRGGYY